MGSLTHWRTVGFRSWKTQAQNWKEGREWNYGIYTTNRLIFQPKVIVPESKPLPCPWFSGPIVVPFILTCPLLPPLTIAVSFVVPPHLAHNKHPLYWTTRGPVNELVHGWDLAGPLQWGPLGLGRQGWEDVGGWLASPLPNQDGRANRGRAGWGGAAGSWPVGPNWPSWPLQYAS